MGYIDAHTHVWFKEVLNENFFWKAKEFTGYELKLPSIEEVIKEMDEANIDYIAIIAYASRELWSTKEDFSIKMIDFIKRKGYASRFSIIGGVEPHRIPEKEVKYWLEKQYEAGVTGFKIHPVHSYIKPNAYREEEGGIKGLRMIYEFAEENNLLIVIHTGTSSFLKARNKYGDPIYLDDLALDFPRLKIIMAHMGRPNWVSTAFQLTRIRSNIYAEISSIPPKRLLDYIPRIEEIAEKTIYGSDYGGPGVKGISENLKEFLSIKISEDSKKKIADINPRRLYKTIS